MSEHWSDRNWIWVRGKCIGHPEAFNNFINIYAPQSGSKKRVFWANLQKIVDKCGTEPLCFFGDFNCIRNSSECLNSLYKSKDSDLLNSFIANNNLWDIPLSKCTFTWFGPFTKCSQLDRMLHNQSWDSSRSRSVQGLGRFSSDHCSLLLT